MKNAIYALLALLAAVIGVWRMIAYVNSVKPVSKPTGDLTTLIIAVVCIVAALGLGALFMAGRVNKEEELHITK